MICSPGSSRHLEKDGQGLAKPASACAKTFLISLILAYCTITFALPLTGVWQSRCWWGGFVAGLSRSGESTEHCCYCLGWPSKSDKSSGQLLIINVSNIINCERITSLYARPSLSFLASMSSSRGQRIGLSEWGTPSDTLITIMVMVVVVVVVMVVVVVVV